MTKLRKVPEFKYILAIFVRFVLLHSSFKSSIHDRVEISTPLNSWKRLLEGIYLFNENVDPYSGDLFHESPLILITFRFLIQALGPWIEVFFVATDILTAFILSHTASLYIAYVKDEEDDKLKKGEYVKSSSNLVVTKSDLKDVPSYVAYMFLFNPYLILNCVGFTTSGLSNLLLAGIFYSMVTNKKIVCILLLSLETFKSFYTVVLIVPVCLQFYNHERTKKCVCEILVIFLVVLGGISVCCYWIAGNWNFIYSTFGFIIFVNDLTPNIGLFWYFFTEMFDHFRDLFISALQINATVLYLFPLGVHLRKEPIFFSYILVALAAVFKSYPSVGDVGFYISFLPLWKHLFFFMQQTYVITCFFLSTSVLGPTMLHLWIYAGSANANFFFGVTLLFATAQIFLITDLLFAHKRRTFAMQFGLPDKNSSECTLVLD